MITKKDINIFFKEIKRLKDTLDKITGFGREPDVWPFGHERENNSEDCFKREDGLWESKKRINTHIHEKGAKKRGHRCIFLWRVMPNYNSKDMYNGDAFLKKSEREKVILVKDGYEFVWTWNSVTMPTETCFGMKMGPTYFLLRKNGKEIVQALTKAGFTRKVLEYIESKKPFCNNADCHYMEENKCIKGEDPNNCQAYKNFGYDLSDGPVKDNVSI